MKNILITAGIIYTLYRVNKVLSELEPFFLNLKKNNEKELKCKKIFLPTRIDSLTEKIVYYSKEEVENVLNKLSEAIKELGDATLSCFYRFSGIPMTETADVSDYDRYRLGWKDLSKAIISKHSSGYYCLAMPPLEKLIDEAEDELDD